MSRGCYKAFGRKVNGPANHTSIQFDKLFCENSNKPSASKSAGTVGKWGITSFTSIRSSSFTVGTKRARDKPKDVVNKSVEVESAALPRPKKFFKSRNFEDEAPKAKPNIAPPPRVANPSTNKKVDKVVNPPQPRHYVKTTNRPTRVKNLNKQLYNPIKSRPVTEQFLKNPSRNMPIKWNPELKKLMEVRGITEADLSRMLTNKTKLNAN